MSVMAILQDVDKCVRCNGCVISCKRTWQMKGILPVDKLPHQKVAPNQRVVIKPQNRVDNAPFVRFSCWHCPDPPCAKRCPWSAIVKDAASGHVYIDTDLCDPSKPTPSNPAGCQGVCQTDCGRGGFPWIGDGATGFAPKAWKCTMCHGRSGSDGRASSANQMIAKYGNPLPTKIPLVSGKRTSPLMTTDLTDIPELDHQPACVYTCPAKAMHFDTRANVIAFLQAGQNDGSIISAIGDGSVFWYSTKYMLISPKADPFIEDHVAPMVGKMLSTPFAKAAVVPTLVVGGLLALSARRASIAREQAELTGGEA